MTALNYEHGSEMQLLGREEMEEEVAIEKLIDHGINGGDVRKLQDAGIHTCISLMKCTKRDLTRISGLSKAKVERIREAAEGLGGKKMMNLNKTKNMIGRKDILWRYLKNRKRCEELHTAIMLNCPSRILKTHNHKYLPEREQTVSTGTEGELSHWIRELDACKKRVERIQVNNINVIPERLRVRNLSN